MTAKLGFELHPGAAQDINDIWEYIAEDNPLAVRTQQSIGIHRPLIRYTVFQ